MSKGKQTELRDGKLVVTYKVGRKTRREEYDVEDGEAVPGSEEEEDLELAIHDPKMFWLRVHKNKKLKV